MKGFARQQAFNSPDTASSRILSQSGVRCQRSVDLVSPDLQVRLLIERNLLLLSRVFRATTERFQASARIGLRASRISVFRKNIFPSCAHLFGATTERFRAVARIGLRASRIRKIHRCRRRAAADPEKTVRKRRTSQLNLGHRRHLFCAGYPGRVASRVQCPVDNAIPPGVTGTVLLRRRCSTCESSAHFCVTR